MRIPASLTIFFLISTVVTSGTFSQHSQELPAYRAVWVDAFNQGIRTSQEIDELIADVKSANMNMIIAQVRKRGDSYYRLSSIVPFTEDPAVPKKFDPLEYLIAQAHRNNIQVHAWINAMTIWRAQDQAPQDARHPFNAHGRQAATDENWLTCDESGESKFPVGFFLDAGHPGVGNHLAQVAAEITRNYRVDGIHLDYIRYPETDDGAKENGKRGVGYNAVSVQRFNATYKLQGKPALNDPRWQAWRRDQVTQVVKKIRSAILKENPKVALSAALIPWGDGPMTEAGWAQSAPCIRVFQDWHAWRKEGLLDICVPMNYDREQNPAHKEFYDHWIAFEKAYKYKSKLIVGVGAYLNSLDDTIAQSKRAMMPDSNGNRADGICYFSYASFKKAAPAGNRPTFDQFKNALTRQGGPFAISRK